MLRSLARSSNIRFSILDLRMANGDPRQHPISAHSTNPGRTRSIIARIDDTSIDSHLYRPIPLSIHTSSIYESTEPYLIDLRIYRTTPLFIPLFSPLRSPLWSLSIYHPGAHNLTTWQSTISQRHNRSITQPLNLLVPQLLGVEHESMTVVMAIQRVTIKMSVESGPGRLSVYVDGYGLGSWVRALGLGDTARRTNNIPSIPIE
jgi:hypothetical protein